MLGILAHELGRRTTAQPRAASAPPRRRRLAAWAMTTLAAFALPVPAQEANLPLPAGSLDGVELAQNVNPAEQVSQLLERAQQLLEEGQYSEAIAAAEQVFQYEIDNPDAQRLILDARERAQASEIEQTNGQARAIAGALRDGQRHLRRGRLDQARAAAEQVLAADPSNTGAAALLTEIAAAEQAAQQEMAARAQAEEIEQLLDRSRRSLRAEDFATAQSAAEQVLAADPSNADAQELLDRIARRQAEAAQAQTEAQIEALLDQSRSALRAGDHAAASEAANQVLALDAENSAAMGLLSDIASAQSQAEQAQASADAAARLQGLLDSAQAQLDRQDYAGALATLEEAEQLDPGNRRVGRFLRRAQDGLADQQRRTQQQAESARQQQEQEAAAQAAQAEAERRAAEEAAQAEAQRAASAQMVVDSHVADGQAALASGDLDAAIQSFQAALSTQPDHAAAQEGLAQAQQAAAARAAELTRADSAEAAVRAGQEALAAGDYAEAEMQFQLAQSLAPGHEGAQQGLAQLAQVREDQLAAQARAQQEQAAAQVQVAQAQVQTTAESQASQAMARSDQLVDEASALAQAGNLPEAENRLMEALSAWSENPRARRALERVQRQLVQPVPGVETAAVPPPAGSEAAPDTVALIEGLLQEGRDAYAQGDVITAVERWNRVIELDPNNDYALTYLQNTEAEHRGALALAQSESESASRRAAMDERLSTPISITTPPEGTALQVFLENISVFTDLNFVIADGVQATVTGSFVEQPLRTVLESVITTNGLLWSVEDNIITVRPNLQTRVFQLAAQDAQALRIFQESGMLDQMLYPPDGVSRVRGEAYELDDVTGTFIITGSAIQMDRVDSLVADLGNVSPTVIETRIFRVRPQEGERLRTLVEAILEAERTPQTEAFDRRIILQGENLIVRATDSEIRRVEAILADYGGEGEGMGERGLDVATFSLIPRRVLQQNEEVARDLATSIVETVTTLLYSQIGVDAARRQGRRLWFDEFTLQLTITDTPDNIDRVTRYISSIPVLEPRRITRIVNLNHQVASTLAGKLEDFLDIEIRGGEGGGSSQQAGGNVIVRTLRADDEFTFRDIRITLVNVVENDVNNDRDETVTLLIDTLTSSEERDIEELRSEIVDDYRIRIVDARASGSGSGNSGRAEIEITYLGQGQGTGGGNVFQAIPATEGLATGQGAAGGQQQQENIEQQIEDERIPVVQADDDTNSLLISVVNPGDLALIEEAIELLDTPILQASIETKFVEVNESRARELKSQMSLSGIGQEGINFSDSFFAARYAQDTDEFRNVFESAPESPINSNLPKGTTVLTLITGGRSPLTWELAFLEAEGVINTVNGPFITAQNNQGAQFTITQQFQRMSPLAGGGTGTTGGTDNQGGGTTTVSGFTGSGSLVANIEMVDMDVTPTISQSGYITLDLDVTISNFSNQLGQAIFRGGLVPGVIGGTGPGAPFGAPTAIANYYGVYSNNLKELQTTARVRDGGTIVLGGWTLERVTETSSGIPVLRNLPYVGQVFFSRNQDFLERLTLLIFLTARIVPVE